MDNTCSSMVATHAHEDHLGGLPGAFNYATADLTLCPVTSYDSDAFEDFEKYAKQKGGGITVPYVGDTYTLGSATVTVLGVNGGEDTNDTSIVLKVQYGETSFLFTGDAERPAEQIILDSGLDLSATVLKVGHHGANTSTSDGKTVKFTVERNAGINTLVSAVTATPTPTPTPAIPATPSEPIIGEDVEQPVGIEYILNTNSKKFHYPSCKSVKQMSDKNKGHFTGTRDEVIAKGYSPCGNCDP